MTTKQVESEVIKLIDSMTAEMSDRQYAETLEEIVQALEERLNSAADYSGGWY